MKKMDNTTAFLCTGAGPASMLLGIL